MAKRPKTVSIRIYEETRDALLSIQSHIRAEQVRQSAPRKKSTFADLIAIAVKVQEYDLVGRLGPSGSIQAGNRRKRTAEG